MLERAYENEIVQIEPNNSAALQAMVSAEVDIQVSTAKRYPRSIERALKTALSMATIDEDTAASCMYALPRGGKTIEGPSIRLAEIFATAWGNLRIEARIVGQDDRWITSRAVCWDLETNNAVSLTVQRRITGSGGAKFNEDMIGVTSNAANSIARRNAIFATVPRTYISKIYDECKKVAVGTAQTLSTKRTKALEAFAKLGIHSKQIFTHFGVEGEADINLQHLAIMIGVREGIRAGEITVDEAFPAPQGQEEKPAGQGNGGVKQTAESAKERMRGAKKDEAKPTLESHLLSIGMDEDAQRNWKAACESKNVDPEKGRDFQGADAAFTWIGEYVEGEGLGL